MDFDGDDRQDQHLSAEERNRPSSGTATAQGQEGQVLIRNETMLFAQDGSYSASSESDPAREGRTSPGYQTPDMYTGARVVQAFRIYRAYLHQAPPLLGFSIYVGGSTYEPCLTLAAQQRPALERVSPSM